MSQPIRLAIGCKARSGKDTAAEYLAKRYGCTVLRASEKVYEIAGAIQKTLGKPVEKDPELLQKLAEMLKSHYGNDIFAADVVRRAAEIGGNVVIADLRFPVELEAYQAAGFHCIKVVRANRPIDRDPDHISETALDDVELPIIYNDSTLEDFYNRIEEMLFVKYSCNILSKDIFGLSAHEQRLALSVNACLSTLVSNGL